MRVLITGASKGIGRAIAQRLVHEKWEVFGTSRRPDLIPDEERIGNVTYLPLELTESRSIESLVSEVANVDCLINNSGMAQIGPVEEISMDEVRYLFELNLLGAIHLIQGFLPGMREKRSGFIINITSMADRIAIPFSSIYAATKHGLLGLTKGLRNELRSFGIRAISVSPIFIRTELPQLQSINEPSPYREMATKVKANRDDALVKGIEPERVGDLIVRILNSKRPRHSYFVGRNASSLALMQKLLPEKTADTILRRNLGLP